VLVQWAAANEQSPFRTLILPYGISLDVPASADSSGYAGCSRSEIDFDVRELRQLLDIRQPLSGSYSRLILTVGIGKRATQQEIKSLSAVDLQDVESEYRTTMEAMSKHMRLRMSSGTRLPEDINGKTHILT
jgi:hypothetical protein